MTKLLKLSIILSLLLSGCGIACAESEPSEIVLQTIAMESANQSLYGQALVAKTIQNRARMGNISLESVVFKPKQYSCWNSRKWAKVWLDKHYSVKARQNALFAYKQAIGIDLAITHYHTLKTKPFWAKGKRPVVIEGNHAFYGGIK